MLAEVSSDLSVADIAKLCNVSESWFRRLFLKTYGVTPSEYRITERMKYAKKLLKFGDINITETARLAGFSDVYYFSKCFKARNGITPSEFIKLG